DGHSLAPLLKDPETAWPHASITTHRWKCHSLRTKRWRYIRYADGGEELYDHDADPNEWRNLAGDDAYAEAKRKMRAHLPKTDSPLVKTPDYDPQKAAREAYDSLRRKTP
ncbi:MAG: sulfatase/phosphatase domain-containing protein, partial [Phycisphaerae bacterium]